MKYMKMQVTEGSMDISKIVLGTDYFGTTVTEDTALRIMDVFADAGGNCVDTARMYACWLPGGEGASERCIGKWIKTRGNRNSVIISTKGGHPPLDQMNSGRLSRKEIESDLDDSLKTLGVDTIDLYWLHRDDVTRPVEDIMESLYSVIKKGKVRAIGCSNWKSSRIEEANRFALANSLIPFCASQIQWSLAVSTPDAHNDLTITCMNEHEHAWYKKENFPVFAYSSQAKGFFARAASQGLDAINKKANDRFYTPENVACLERVKEYAGKYGMTPTGVALGYILNNPVTAVAIVGCKNEAQLIDTLTAADIELPETIINWLKYGAI